MCRRFIHVQIITHSYATQITMIKVFKNDSVIEPVPCLHTSKVHSVSSEGTCEFLNCESDAEPPVLSQPEATVFTNSTPFQPEIKAIPHSTPIQPETKTTPDPILPITPRSNLEKCPEIDGTLQIVRQGRFQLTNRAFYSPL